MKLTTHLTAGCLALSMGWTVQAQNIWNVEDGDWTAAGSWVAPPVFGAGTTADLSQVNQAGQANATVDAGLTIGTLLVGDTDGDFSYVIDQSGGSALTYDNSGSGASITSVITSAGDTYNLGSILADDLTIDNASANQFLFDNGASFTGTGNIIINTSGAGGYEFEGNFNHTGTITYNATTAGSTRFEGGISENVSSFIHNGSSGVTVASSISLDGDDFVVEKTAASTGNFATEQALTGTGDLILTNDAATGDINIRNADNAGDIINNGTGTNNNQFGAGGTIGANVENVIQASASSGLNIRATLLTDGDLTLVNNGGANLRVLGSVSGTGDLYLQNNTANGGDALAFEEGGTINHSGAIINEGTGTGVTRIDKGITSNVTAIIQNSVTSMLIVEPGSVANNYIGNTMIADSATLRLANNALFHFDIGASGFNNSVSGLGTFDLDGDIAFDLLDAEAGGTWEIFDIDGGLTVDYATTFEVVGFTETFVGSGIWEMGDFTFTETDGILVSTAIPEPASAAMLVAGLGLLALRRRRR